MLPITSRSSGSGSVAKVRIRRTGLGMPFSMTAVPMPEKCDQSGSGYE